MNKELEKIFDKALSELKQGASLEEAVLKYQPEQQNLAEGLALAQELARFPKKAVPQPAMQRKYALAPAKVAWYHWLHFSKLATVSMSLMLLLSAIVSTGYAAYHSMPGQALFAVKKTAENLQLQFASSSEKKLSLQVEFSKKRLMEAEQILKNPESSQKTAQAAVKELKEQTKSTLESVTTATKNDLDIQKAKTIVKSLETIASDQEKLAKEVNNETSKDIVADVEASAKVINNYILIAANELEKSNIKNDKTSASTTPDTASSTASEIVKTDKASTTTSTLKTLVAPKIEEVESLPDPNMVTSGYIPETPEPQYAPSPILPAN